jgi:hypothetical protein
MKGSAIVQINLASTPVALAFVGLVFVVPVLLVSYGRRQGWEMATDCVERALGGGPAAPGSQSLMRKELGLGPVPEMSYEEWARAALASCSSPK